MKYLAHLGQVVDARCTLDDDGVELIPDPGYPKVVLREGTNVLARVSAVSLGNSEYQAQITVPLVDELEGAELTLTWVLVSNDGGSKIQVSHSDTVQVIESEQQADTKELVTLANKPSVPFEIMAVGVTSVSVSYYSSNQLLGTINLQPADIAPKASSTLLNLPMLDATVLKPSLVAYDVIVEFTAVSIPNMVSNRLWVVNPSILSNAQSLLSWLDKSQIKNTLPNLRYELPDLINYLTNGLNKFNGLGSHLTSFNGLNMTGIIAESWQICSAWYMLSSQYLAEGNMAFDLQAQATTLSVDRTQFIDSILGRIETQLQDQVIKTKNLLIKSNVTGGDGNVANLSLRVKTGRLALTRHSLTQYKF